MSINYDMPKTRECHKPSVGISFDGEATKTIQSMAAECEISTIMRRYKRGQISAADFMKGRESMLFGDFSNVKSLQDMYAMVEDAQRLFNSLPTAVKEHFAYDAHAFVAAASDERNRGLFEELGLVEKKVSVASAPKGSEVLPDPNITT